MPQLDPQLVAMLALGAVAASVVSTGVAVIVALRLRRLRAEQRRAFGGEGDTVVDVLGRQGVQLETLRRDLRDLDLRADELRRLLTGVVSKVGVVRYDAFEDMGGALSFSAALLDEQGDGIVVSAINGRTETRCYAKSVARGGSEHSLSGEEVAAVESAMTGREPTATAPRRRRRRVS